jgi:KDO2-lipid IV(A) lauroyltransferase
VFRFVAAVMAALPLEAASAFSGWGWRQVAPWLPRHKRALDNLAAAYPNMSRVERERIALAMWDNLGRNFAEFFHLTELATQTRIELQAPDHFQAFAESGAFVVCTLHMGNWEIMALAGKRFGVPLTGVYQQLTNELVDAYTFERRAPLYDGGLLSKSSAAARALLRTAREGGNPCFVADLREKRGVPTVFFGRKAMSNPFPALIARSVGIPLYAARVLRKPGVHFQMRIEEVEVPRSADREADVLAATQALQTRFEEFVREAPEQWMWAHRRWD